MDEDEDLYREIDEEDDLYMGDRDDDYESGAEYAYCNTSRSNNVGCVLLPLILVFMTLMVVLVV